MDAELEHRGPFPLEVPDLDLLRRVDEPAGATVEGSVSFRAQSTADKRVFSLLYDGRGKAALTFGFPLGDLVTQVPPPPPDEEPSATISASPS